MRRIKRALSLKGKSADDTLSELAEQMSFEVNGKDNGESVKCHMLSIFCKLFLSLCLLKHIILARSLRYITSVH